jgi:hypothetical protein
VAGLDAGWPGHGGVAAPGGVVRGRHSSGPGDEGQGGVPGPGWLATAWVGHDGVAGPGSDWPG